MITRRERTAAAAALTGIVATVALGLGACASPPAAPGELQPTDFATGITVETPANQPFVSVAVPDDVFATTAWPDLRDLRVFNAASEPVPFARVAPTSAPGEKRRLPLQPFRLRAENPGGVPQIELDARARGVELRVRPGMTPEAGAEYLLAVDQADVTRPSERLYLDWHDEPRNWQQRVTVSVSRDLQNWNVVAYGRPLMDLRTEDGSRLKHAEIAVDRTAQQTGRYWRLKFDSGFSPRLTSVEGEATDATPPPPRVQLPTTLEVNADGTVEYRLARPHPISHLRITPSTPNSVVPLQIEGRGGEADKDKWESLGRTVAFRINVNTGGEQFSEPVPIGGRLLTSVRLRALGASWGALQPVVTAEREALILVINTRGAGPFLLAWGSRAAADTAVALATLAPTLDANLPVRDQFPEGRLGTRHTLGGESRLTAESPADRAARWQTILVWVALVGGAGALAFLALRLLRETRQPH